MSFRTIAPLALVATIAVTPPVRAQQPTGDIFGRVTDQSGAAVPGVTVTLTSAILLQPLVALTSETGTYQFPRLEVANYSARFELAGFTSVLNEDIIVTAGFSAQINAQLAVSTVQETVTVSGQTPIIDTRETGTKQTFTNDMLQTIPSARDPWVILQQTAGIALDRENVGGSQSGNQSVSVSRGANPFNNKWTLDGVDITDLSTGASPTYYDFDAFEGMTISTGGVDVTQQTGGIGISLITKSGSDTFRGSGRFYITDDSVEANNISDSLRGQGASSGNPIKNIQDYGTEMGGPIRRGRAWAWGAFGRQAVDVGVIGFYQTTAQCQAIKADALSYPVDQVNACLNTDRSTINTTNLKGEILLFKGNKLSLFSMFSVKQRPTRGASDSTPLESTVRQDAVPSTYGTNFWLTGPVPTYKFGDQYVVSDRLLLDVQYAHVGNNFITDYHDPSYPTQIPEPGVIGLQPTSIILTGLNGRSTPQGNQSVSLRPVNSVTVSANYFLPGAVGADHSFRIGGHWRDNDSYGSTHTPGMAVARFPTSAELASANDCATLAVGCQTNLTRDGITDYKLTNLAIFGQDTITRGRTTIQLGLRYDYNHDRALPSSVPENYLLPAILPAVNFSGADPGVRFNNFSPRIGFTRALTDSGKTLVRANYAMYWGQVGVGVVAGTVNPVTPVFLRYNWVDLNHDTFVQANEIYDSKGVPLVSGGNPVNLLAKGGNWDPTSPASPTTSNTVDPNLKNDRTDEFIVGFDREVGLGFAIGANYIWRRYTNFQFSDTLGLQPSDYTAVSFTPAASSCPGADGNRVSAANCPTVTYYQPNFQLPIPQNLTNYTADQYHRTYNGVELTARKRMSNRWLMNTSATYNSLATTMSGWAGNSTNAIGEDPTNRSTRDGFQSDFVSGGSGLGTVYVNARWLFKASGVVNLKHDVNVSGFYNARQGYPEELAIMTPSRANGASIATVLLNGVGETRLADYQNLDLHVDRPVKAGTFRVIPQLDVFNVFNGAAILAIHTAQNASNANQIQQILAPRVMRLGLRVTW